MNKIVEKMAALGLPGLVLLTAISATGLSGAAAITTALAALGPGGMIGGIAWLGIIGVISGEMAKYGFENIFRAVVMSMYMEGETEESLKQKVRKYPITKSLKLKLISDIDEVSLVDSVEVEEENEEF